MAMSKGEQETAGHLRVLIEKSRVYEELADIQSVHSSYARFEMLRVAQDAETFLNREPEESTE
jgi:hypothetical protein